MKRIVSILMMVAMMTITTTVRQARSDAEWTRPRTQRNA